MGKIIKIKQSDLKQVINKVLDEQLSDTNVDDDALNIDNDPEGEYGVGEKLTLGQDNEGNYYIFDDEGNIIEKT